MVKWGNLEWTDVKVQWEMCCYLWSSRTEFPNATEAARGSNYMFFFPPFPGRLHIQWAWSPKAGQVPAQLYKPRTVCRIEGLGCLAEVTKEGTPHIKNTGISHSNWEQLCGPLVSVQHPQSPVSIDSVQCKEQPAYRQQCKLLTKPVLLGDVLCILPASI